MAVIGYDGRLRPASTGAMQNPESQFNADRVGRVAAAQPKFSEDVAKLLNDGGQKLVNYGSKVAQQGQELEDLKDAEAIQAEKRKIAEEGRKIREDKTMTPEEKAAKGEELSGRYPSEVKVDEGASHRDQVRARRRAMTLGEAAWQESYRIQQEADRMREASETAKFGADATIADANFGVWADENFPKMHAEGVRPEDARSRLEKAFDEQNKGLVAEMNESQKAEWVKIRGRVLAGALLRYGKSYNEQVRKKAENDLNIVVSGASVGAKSAESAIATAESVLESPTGKEAVPDANKRFEFLIGTGIANTENAVKNTSAEAANAHAVYVEQAKELLAQNDVKGYEVLTKNVKIQTETVFDNLFSRIENDKKAVLGKIESNGNLSEEQKAALKQTVEDKYLKMKDGAEKAKQSALASHRMKAKSASDKVGKANFKNLVDCLAGTSSDLSPDATTVFRLLNPKNFGEVRKDYPKSEATREAYLVMTYSNVAPERRAQHAVTDIKAAIANLDMSAKGDINLFELEKILGSAATVFGADSDEYRDIASFAQRNIVNEKNKWGDQTEAFVNDLVCRGDFSKWEKSASLEDKERRLRYIAYLNEITDSAEYKKAKDSISSMWRTEKRFDMALGIDEISENASRAMESAAVNAKEAANGVSEAQNAASLSKDGNKKTDVDIAFEKLLPGAEKARIEGEIKALNEGSDPKYAKGKANLAELLYWRGIAKDMAYKSSKGLYLGEMETIDSLKRWIVGELESRDAQEKRAAAREKSKKDREETDRKEHEYLIKEAESLGVPTSYTRRSPGYAFNGAFGTGSAQETSVEQYSDSQLRRMIESKKREISGSNERKRKIEELKARLAELEGEQVD